MLVSPDAHNLHPLEIETVREAKRPMDQFSQEGLIEFGYHPAHVGMVGRGLDVRKNFIIPVIDRFGKNGERVGFLARIVKPNQSRRCPSP
jgi:hypothetical protein